MKREDMEKFMGDRAGKTEEELMAELTAMTRQQQSSGELSETKMEEIYRLLAPMLTEKQKEKFRQVIARLKS